MQVDCRSLAFQVAKGFPVPSTQNVLAIINDKFPFLQGDLGRWASGQNGKIRREVLPWWQLYIRGSASASKASRDDTHADFPFLTDLAATQPPSPIRRAR